MRSDNSPGFSRQPLAFEAILSSKQIASSTNASSFQTQALVRWLCHAVASGRARLAATNAAGNVSHVHLTQKKDSVVLVPASFYRLGFDRAAPETSNVDVMLMLDEPRRTALTSSVI